MATIKEYFDTDFARCLNAHKTFTLMNASNHLELDIIFRVHYDFDSCAKYVSYFVPSSDDLLQICHTLVERAENWASSISDEVSVEGGFYFEESTHLTETKFTGRIYIYSEGELSQQEMSQISQIANTKGYSLRFRGLDFAKHRESLQRPICFISHDSRDKDDIARPLAVELTKLMLPVWYDEFSLRLGDSLRESIERGIKECKKCILILSPNFLSNRGWAKTEFESIFVKQFVDNENVILPIWYGVTRDEVYEYSPSLANKKAIQWSSGLEAVCNEIRRTLMT